MAEKPTRFGESQPDSNPAPPDNQPSYRTTPRLEFDVTQINNLISDRGLKTLWEKSFLCPCRTRMTKSPDPSCPICHGRGIGYIPAQEETLIIQNQDRDVSSKDLGLVESGTAIATTEPESIVTFRDRITLPEVKISQSMLFDINQYRLEHGHFLPYDVKEITLALTDDAETIQEGKDFTIDYEKNLFKPESHLLHKNVTLNITTILRYIVIDLLKESRYQYTNRGNFNETFTNLPRKVLLKREDAWVNPIPFTNDEEEPQPEENTQWLDPKRDMNTNTNEGGFFGGMM